jgi:hypothetical protein
MRILLLSISFIIILTDITYSIDTNSTKYFPLKLGNSWTYSFLQTVPPASYRTKNTITDTLTRYGHLYYIMSVITTQGNNADTVRIDSLYGRLLKAGTGCPWNLYDLMIDSLSAHKNDSVSLNCTNTYKIGCTDDTSHFTNWGLNKLKKSFAGGSITAFLNETYIKDIGMSYRSFSSQWTSATYTLIGCIIDGIMYGDTNLVGSNPISNEISSSFQLYQNYPNPFNPTTKLSFSIPPYQGGQGDGLVILKIYDVLGKEIATLVNEQLNPGTYEVEWNAADYPSGIYFYTLTTNEFNQSKRMVLIK